MDYVAIMGKLGRHLADLNVIIEAGKYSIFEQNKVINFYASFKIT